MIYLTYNDAPSGIYNSQVIDVVNYLNTLSAEKVKLISVISLRKFGLNRKKIKQRCPGAIVIPMIPKARFWKWNLLSLLFITLFKKHNTIMARGPFATSLALKLKKNKRCRFVVFDARGAYHAELTEYHVIDDAGIVGQIKEIEKLVIQEADYRLAVSQALVNYWKTHYSYNGSRHVVIPCTLSNDFSIDFPSEAEILFKKEELGYHQDDIIFIYSGSAAGWQSFSLVDDLMCNYLQHPRAKLIVLSNHFDASFKVMQSFKEKVSVLFVEPQQVKTYLQISDYGILFREQSITNQVASPVKFAEYVNCGLKVIISEHLGDYSDFVIAQQLAAKAGEVLSVPYSEKQRIHDLSNQYFRKDTYRESYNILLNL